jgi:predicted DNA-binding transcriptional regulator AlpA
MPNQTVQTVATPTTAGGARDPQYNLITAAELKRQLGGVSDAWLHRALKDETLDFPRPLTIRGRRFWRLSDVEAWIDLQAGQDAA